MLRTLLLLAACAAPLRAFPDGAPAEACLRGMTPNHGGATSRSHQDVPFAVLRHTSHGRVTVTIQAINGKSTLKGFMIQARDPLTGKAARGLGAWLPTKNVKGLPECAAVTHSNRSQKPGISVTWEGREDLAFYVTIVQSYSSFWADVEAVEQGPLGPSGHSSPSGPSGLSSGPSGFRGPSAPHLGSGPSAPHLGSGPSAPHFGSGPSALHLGNGPSGFSSASSGLGRGPSGFSGPPAVFGRAPSGFSGVSRTRGRLSRRPAQAFGNNFHQFGKKK